MSSSSNLYWQHGNVSTRTQEEINADSSDMPFAAQRERRYTTITLREIRFPVGCPCHPADPEAAKKQRLRAPSPDSRPSAFMYHARPELTPRTDSQDSTNSTNSTAFQSSSSRGFGSFFRRTSST